MARAVCHRGIFSGARSFANRHWARRRCWAPRAAGAAQFLIAIYGGYFGGGIGFLMLAVLTIAGMKVRVAGATKNVLAAVMNASAVVIFLFGNEIQWLNAVILGVGAIIGGLVGAHLLQRVNERVLRVGIVVLGLALTVGLFLRQ